MSWASAWLKKQFWKWRKWLASKAPSHPSCDWSLRCCIYDVSASSLMFCAKLIDVLACCLTKQTCCIFFTYLSKNLWSWSESCLQKFIKKKNKNKRNLVVLTFPLKKSYISTINTCFCSGLFSTYILVFRGHFACSLLFKNKYFKQKP